MTRPSSCPGSFAMLPSFDTSVCTTWLGWIAAVCSNQNALSRFSTIPLYGTGGSSTQSNAEIRSVTTIR